MKRDDRLAARNMRPVPGKVAPRRGEYITLEDVPALAQPRQESIDEFTARERKPPPVVLAARRTSLQEGLRRSLSSPAALRQAMLLHAVLGPPAALRDQDDR